MIRQLLHGRNSRWPPKLQFCNFYSISERKMILMSENMFFGQEWYLSKNKYDLTTSLCLNPKWSPQYFTNISSSIIWLRFLMTIHVCFLNSYCAKMHILRQLLFVLTIQDCPIIFSWIQIKREILVSVVEQCFRCWRSYISFSEYKLYVHLILLWTQYDCENWSFTTLLHMSMLICFTHGIDWCVHCWGIFIAEYKGYQSNRLPHQCEIS